MNRHGLRLPSSNGYLVYRSKVGSTIAVGVRSNLTGEGKVMYDEYCEDIWLYKTDIFTITIILYIHLHQGHGS